LINNMLIKEDDFRKDWIDLMSKFIGDIHHINLDVPDKYVQSTFFRKNPVKIDVKIDVIEKYSRSIKIQYIVAGNTFVDIIYLPTSQPITKTFDNFYDKVYKKINSYLKQNNTTFVENEYKNYIDNLNKSISNLNKERIVQKRKKKLDRLNGRV